jgi:hypothetical protein
MGGIVDVGIVRIFIGLRLRPLEAPDFGHRIFRTARTPAPGHEPHRFDDGSGRGDGAE